MEKNELNLSIEDCLNKIMWLKNKNYWDSWEKIICSEWIRLLKQEIISDNKKRDIIISFNSFVFEKYSSLYSSETLWDNERKYRIDRAMDKLRFLIDKEGFDNEYAEDWMKYLAILLNDEVSLADKNKIVAIVEQFPDDVFGYNPDTFIKNRKPRK